jgi:hypothetical protein
MSGAPSTRFHASLVRGTILRRRGGITVSNADDERQEPTRSYGNRGIYLPGLRSARQRLGLTQRDLAARARTGQHPICKLETLRRGGQGVGDMERGDAPGPVGDGKGQPQTRLQDQEDLQAAGGDEG